MVKPVQIIATVTEYVTVLAIAIVAVAFDHLTAFIPESEAPRIAVQPRIQTVNILYTYIYCYKSIINKKIKFV